MNWLSSYSLYVDEVGEYLDNKLGVDWSARVTKAMSTLQEEAQLEEIVRLVGLDALSDKDKLTMIVARMIREDYLQQNAFDDVDTFTSYEKQALMLELILWFETQARKALALGAYYEEILTGTVALRDRIARAKYVPEKDIAQLVTLKDTITSTLKEVVAQGGVRPND